MISPDNQHNQLDHKLTLRYGTLTKMIKMVASHLKNGSITPHSRNTFSSKVWSSREASTAFISGSKTLGVFLLRCQT